MSVDGWSNANNEPALGICLIENGNAYLIDCVDTSGVAHTSDYLYNVVNSIITDRKIYRCIYKVSFYFRGSLYEINVLLSLFLQIEVSI